MLIQDLVDTESFFYASNKPKNPTSYEAKSEVKKSILAEIVCQYIERETSLVSNINKIYGIIWGNSHVG